MENEFKGLDFSKIETNNKKIKKKTLQIHIKEENFNMLQEKFFQFYMENRKKNSDTFQFTNLILNLKEYFIKKYGKLEEEPDETYLGIYKKKRGRGGKDALKRVSFSVFLFEDTIDLLYQIIHTHYKHNEEKKQRRGFVSGEFFDEVVFPWLENEKLKLIENE